MKGKTDWNKVVQAAIREFAEDQPQQPVTVRVPIRQPKPSAMPGRLLFGLVVQVFLLVIWLATGKDFWLQGSSLWWLVYGFALFLKGSK
jgi:hypothetical protein